MVKVMTIQPPPGTDSSRLDDPQLDTTDQNDTGTDERDVDASKGEEDSAGSGGQISEAGGASMNPETSGGGADAVPDSHG